MALISCPECNNQVSNTAEACPQCGAPIAGAKEGHAAGNVLTTTQETSKKLKLQIIFSSVIFWVGVVWIFIAIEQEKNGGESSPVPGLLLLVGMVWYIVTRLRIWWHHK